MDIQKIKKQIEIQEKYSDYAGEDRVVSVQEVYDEEKKNQTEVFFNTGISSLDCIFDGFKKGQVVVITGIAKRGKTTFAKTITKNNQDKLKMLWFSFEEPIFEFYKDIDPCDFYVPRKLKPKNMTWLTERILESKSKYGTEVVFIDHLHYLFNMGQNGQNTTLLIGDLMRTLKSLAVENQLVIFVLAHTKKVEGNRIPRAEDVRDSALIANECDKMFVVHRQRIDGELGGTSMSPETKIVLELDRQNGKNMGYVIDLAFENNLLVTKTDVEQTKSIPKPARKLINW
jgi:replicative DNA helicase